MSRNGRATLADVARRANVSEKTASLALQHGKGSPATVARVEAVAAALGYARNTWRQRRADVLLVTPLGRNPTYFQDLVDAVRTELSANDFRVLHEASDGEMDLELDAIDRGISLRIAGAILVSPRSLGSGGSARLLRAHIPTVVVTARPGEIPPEVSAVHVDYSRGIGGAVEHLLGLGHTRIAYLRGNPSAYSEQQRFRAVGQQLRDQGEQLDSQYVVELQGPIPGFRAGVEACKYLLAMRPRPTAIIAYNDAMAIGCLAVAFERKLCVPGAFSVVGHDGLPVGAYTGPPLSTVAIEKRSLGVKAVNLLLQLMEQDNTSSETLHAYFNSRQSTGPVVNEARDNSRSAGHA